MSYVEPTGEEESSSNLALATRLVECKWCGGLFLTGSLMANLVCIPINYKNNAAHCCCFRFSDSWKTSCLILDVLVYVIMLLLFPLFLVFSLGFDAIILIMGILCCCNLCCTPCKMYGCCECVTQKEHNDRSRKVVDV